jgi:UPF0755 protein
VRTLLRIAAVGVALAFVALAVGLFLFASTLTAPEPGSDQEAAFVVAPGATLDGVASSLHTRGLIRNERNFVLMVRWKGEAGSLRAGEYLLSPALDAEEVLERLVAGNVRTHPVALPEGLTLAEIAVRLDDAGLADADAFLAEARSPEVARELGIEADGLEGYVYPETYRMARGLPTRTVVETLVAPIQELWPELAPAAEELGLSMHQVVTLASIIEKETAVAEERPLISAVFHNRLKRGMRLETDPTVIYGIPDFDGNLRRAHLEDATNPYNTYQNRGLPPGPIASAGEAALRAAVAPADVPYIFFVSRNDGTHVFSKTYREHVNAVNRYQRGGS